MATLPPNVNTTQQIRPYNVPIYGVRGEFSLSASVVVPYFSCLMDIERVTKELKTHEEVNPTLTAIYSLEELYQREIDGERVQREIVNGFLKVQNKLKFFNSLTIVLLPKDESGKVTESFEDYQNNNPHIPDQRAGDFDAWFSPSEGQKLVTFGGVQFVASETANLARLRWDANRVDAVAVDGQHRLRALKIWMKEKNDQLSDIEKRTNIPVLFLLLNDRAGFKVAADKYGVSIKTIAREIFTDLNKNAKEVDRATQIILDDLSLEARCVRSLVTPTTCTDHTDLLPLSLLRWREPNNRFDQKYYLNSIVNLHLLIKDLFGLKSPDPMDQAEVREFIKQAKYLLGTGEPRSLLHNGIDLDDYYKQVYLQEGEDEPIAPFSSIPVFYLDAAVQGFKQHFAPWLLKILTRFKPYKDILEYARSQSILTGEFSQYLSQPISHQANLAQELEQRHGVQWRSKVIEAHVEAIEKLKGLRDDPRGEQWAFKTIFQKAIVRLGKQLFVLTPQDQMVNFGSIDDYIEFLDELHSREVFRVHAPLQNSKFGLWTFIAVNFGNKKIKASAQTEGKIFSLITLWYYCYRYAKIHNKKIEAVESENSLTPKQLLKIFTTQSTQTHWPKCIDLVRDLTGQSVFGGTNASVYMMRDIPAGSEDKYAKMRLEEVLGAPFI